MDRGKVRKVIVPKGSTLMRRGALMLASVAGIDGVRAVVLRVGDITI